MMIMMMMVMMMSNFRNISLSMTQRFRMWVLGFHTTQSDTSYQSFGETCRLRPWCSNILKCWKPHDITTQDHTLLNSLCSPIRNVRPTGVTTHMLFSRLGNLRLCVFMEFYRAKRTACVLTLLYCPALPSVRSNFLFKAVPRKQTENCFMSAYNLRYKNAKLFYM
jgi:hypothetical protein